MTSPAPLRMVYLCLQPMTDGSASQAHVTGICEGLRDQGWDVELFAVSSPRSVGLGGRTANALGVQARMARRLVRRPPDVLYVRWHPLATVGVAIARLSGVPVVLEINGPADDFTQAWPRLSRLRRVIERSLRWQLSRAILGITVTAGLRAWLQTEATVPVVVIPNAADTTRFQPASGRSDRPYALYFGALAPWQGVMTLLAATGSPEWPADLQLWVAGDGALRDEVEIAAAHSPDRVRYLGPVPSDQMPTVVAQSDMVLIVKEYQRPELGLSPIKLYESMSSGVPVIVSELPGLADVVRAEDCGRVISHHASAEEIARAVRELHQDEPLRRAISDRARTAAIERHTWTVRAVTTELMIAASLQNRASRS